MIRNTTDTDKTHRAMEGHVRKHAISLASMVNISDSLASLVQGMLGPGGQQTLLSTPTGKVLVTRDGMTILSSLHLAHPLAHFIMQSLRSHSTLHHDGSKTFILYLSQVMKGITDYLGGESSQNAMSRVKLSIGLNQFLCTDFEHIAKLVVEKVKVCSARSCEQDCMSVVKDVLKSSLYTCLQKQMVPFFTNCLVTFLSLENPGQGDLELQLAHILQHFDMYHTKVSTQPQQKSRICQGVLLETNLQAICQDETGACTKTVKRFALMDINFSEAENMRGENTVAIHLSSDKVASLLSHNRALLQHVLNMLKSAGVHVLLCSETVPQYVQGLCRENGISMHCLQHEKLAFLRGLTGVPIITDLREDMPAECFFTGRISSFVHIGRRVCTMIEITGTNHPLNHLVVCAPTEGLCDQLCQFLYKALKAVSECLKPCLWGTSGILGPKGDDNTCERNVLTSVHEAKLSVSEAESAYSQQTDRILKNVEDSSTQSLSRSPVTVSCGGTFEAVLFTAISEYYSAQKHRPVEHVDTLVQKMLLSVPQTLHTNLCSAKFGEQRQFTEKWTSMLSMVREGQLIGLGIHGVVTQNDCIEPVGSKLSVVASVLQLVVQLLRVEAVVPVKKLLSGDSAGEPSDDKTEYEDSC